MARAKAPELRYAESVAEGLRLARLSAGLGFRESARKLGLTTSSLWRIESGTFRPTDETLVKMLRLYRANLNVGPDGVMLTWLEQADEN